jgi:parvulin-like peptidyl-prolyl isomerase
MKSTLLRAAVLAASVVACGCGLSEQPQPLIPSQFVRSRAAVGPNPIGQPVGQSGALAYGELHMPLLPDEYTNTHPKPSPGVSPLVQHEVPAPGEGDGVPPRLLGPQTPTSRPEPGQATGYQVVGTVVATVNTTPIFADKVLATLDHELAAEAQKYVDDPQQFRREATKDINGEILKRIEGQLDIEQANVSLAQDAKNEASLMAQYWRRQQIAAAGGSEAVARERALESGETLDELTLDQYNTALVRLYYQQHIAPRIHVTVAEMRRYYDEHRQSDYSTQAEARFRLIRIDFAHNGGPEEALAKAKRIIDDLKAGANFEDEAKKFNDDPSLQQSGGDIGWMQKGGYKYDAVEQAVWALKPKQFTDHPIEVSDSVAGNAFYIANLEEKRGGTEKSFDDVAVQNVIYSKLSSQQFNELLSKDRQERWKKNAVVVEPNGLETAVDMAMQRYPPWASAR